MKEIKVEWCENFIRAAFGKHHPFAGNPNAGIEVLLFWELAEEAGLWIRGTYDTPMSQALENLCEVKTVCDNDNRFLYAAFRMKKEGE